MDKNEYLDSIKPADKRDECPYCGCYAEDGKVSNCVNTFCPSMAD